jgi:hypothetical protein
LRDASDVDVTRKTMHKISSSALSSSYLPYILLSAFLTITIIMISCSSSVAAAANNSIMSTMKSVHENATAKSAIETTSLFSSQCSTDSTSRLQPTSSLPISNKTLSVNGIIDLTNSSIRLEPFMILPGSTYTTRPANSSFSINLLDNEGKILARYPFNPKISTYVPENKHNIMALLSEAVPYILCTKQIEISKDGNEVASRYVSANAPQAKVIFPNGGEILKDKLTVRWQASDVDGDHLTYFLLYSTDNGFTWQTVAKKIKESQLTVNVTELPGSTKALFRVIATDGVNTGIDDSDDTFTVPSRLMH